MIKLDNVTKTFKKDSFFGKSDKKGKSVEAVKNLSLTVESGDIFGIVGRSGAGKSTMLRLIGLLDVPTTGTIQIDGKIITNIKSSDAISIKRNIGTVFQGFNLLMQRNIEKNIAFPMELSSDKKDKSYIKNRVEELAGLVGLSDKLKSYPAELSGGQKQRVAIARALATEPKVLLCDEPTSALDSFTTKEILKLLVDINKKLGITIVIITHELSVVKAICNKTLVLHNGSVAEVGLTKQVFNDPQSPVTKELISYIYDDLIDYV